MTKAKVPFLVLFACVLAVAITACGSSGSDSSSAASESTTAASGDSGAESETTSGSGGEEGKALLEGAKVSFANYTDAAPVYLELKKGVEAAAQETGVDLSTYDNKGEAQQTLQNAQLMANSNPDMIMDLNPVAGTTQSAEDLFERGSIPCIAVNVPGAGYCPWIDLSNQALGTEMAKVVAKEAEAKGWKASDIEVILVQSAGLGPAVNSSIGFYYEELSKLIPGLPTIGSFKDIGPETTTIGDSVVQVNGEALRQPSFEAVENALQTIPADKHLIIYSISDESSLGAYTAVQRAGRQDDLLITGLAGSEEGLEQLRNNPAWVAEGDVFFSHWGEYLMAMAAAIMEGQETPDMTAAPIATETKNLSIKGTGIVPISTYYKPNSVQPYRLPPLQPEEKAVTSAGESGTVGNQYLEKTGVLQLFGNVTGLEK